MAKISKKQELKELQIIPPTYLQLFNLQDKLLSIPYKEWTPKHALAYLLIKYKQKFNKDFVLSFEEPISKSFEYKSISKIAAMLGAHACEFEKVKDYIDWYIDNYNGKRSFRSVGALIKIENICDYKDLQTKQNTISKSTRLPQNVLNYIDNCFMSEQCNYIKTYGDLLFLYLANLKTQDQHLVQFFEELKQINFDISKIKVQ